MIPKPSDPRSPLQRTRDQLTAARRRMVDSYLPYPQRLDLADRIRQLEQEEQRLLPQQA